MKKLIMLFVAMFVLLGVSQSFACHITFESEDLKTVQVDEIVRVEAVVTLEHRRCVLEDDDVNIELSKNLTILSETGWQKLSSDEIRNIFEIKVSEAGEATLRVFRECSKKGISEGVLKFQIVE